MMDALKANMDSICRFCLTKVDDPSTMQTLEDEETDTMWTSSVRSFTLKKPMLSENLPNKMCRYCAMWITKLIHFKLQCTMSELLLTSFLKHYKEEVEKTTAVVRVGEQQGDIPGPNTRELLSRCDDHLSRLHKAVLFTVAELDNCASNGQPVLPYRKTKTNQFFMKFIDQVRLYVNSVIPTDGEGILRIHMKDKEQPWGSGNIPVCAQENSKQTFEKFWDRLIQATCCPTFTQNDNSGVASGKQPSSQNPLLQAVPSHSSVRSAACSEKSQTFPVIQLDDDDDDDDILPQSSNLSKSLKLKQAVLSATSTSQPHRLVTRKPKALSKQVGENIPNLPKTAESRKKLNDVSEVLSSNIEAQQHGSSKPSEDSVQLTSPAVSTNISQAVQVKTSKSQSDTQLSNSAGVSVPLESLMPKSQETVLATEVFSDVSELLIPSLVQVNLEDETLQSSVIHGSVECTQDVQKSVKQLTGLKGLVVEHPGSLGISNSALSAKKTGKSVQTSQHAQELKCQEVLKKTSESQETVKQTLGMQEVNRLQEQTNKAGSMEVTSQTTSLQKQPKKICQEQMNKTSKLETSEKHQTGSEQPREAQMTAIQAAEANKSTSSSSGQESSTKSTQEPRLQPTDKQRICCLILPETSQANKREKTVPLIIKSGNRVCSYEESVSTGPKKHVTLRIESEPVDKVSQPSGVLNAIVYRLKPLIPMPKSTIPNIPSSVSSISELEKKRIIQEIPSGVGTSIDSENTVPSTSRSSQQPNRNTSQTSTTQKNSNLSQTNTENSAVNSNAPMLQPIQRNEENRKSGEEAPTAEEPVVSTGIIRVQQDVTTDPPTRSSSHNSKDVPLSTSNMSQQKMQYNGTEWVSEPSGQQSQATIPTFLMASMNRMAVSQQLQANSRVVVMPVSSPLSRPVQRFQHNPQTLGTPVPVLYPQQPSVKTYVKKPVQAPQHKNNPIFGTLQHQMAQAGTSTSTSQQPWSTITVQKYQKTQTGAAIDSAHFTKGPRMTALMVQTEKIPPGTSRFVLQTNVPEQEQQQAKIATLVQTSLAGQQQQQAKPTTSISQANVLGQQQQATPTTSILQANVLGQQQQAKPTTTIWLANVLGQQQQTKPTTSISQANILGQLQQTKPTTSISQANVLGQQQQTKPTTSISQANILGQLQQTKPTTSISQANVLGQQQQTKPTTSISQANILGQQQQTKPTTSISQANILGQQQQTKPTTSISQKVMQSTNIMLQHQTKKVQSSPSPLVAEKLSASGTCFPNPTAASKAINVSVPKVYKSATGVPVPSASDNQSNKQQFVNVNTQYNKTLLQSKQQNALSTAGSNGNVVVDVHKPSEDGGRVVLESEAGARNTDQPGTSVLPEVVQAIGPELGICIREDGLKSSVCRTTPCKFPIVVPEHCFMPKQSNKSSMQRSPKGAAALTLPVKLKIITPIKANSKEFLGVSEERGQKLPATVSNPSIRRSNLPIKSPGFVTTQKYFNRKKQELKKQALPVHKEPEPPPNVTVHQLMDNMLQSEVAASSENHSEAKKPCDFQIKITKNNNQYKSSPEDHSAIQQTEFDPDSSDSWQPPALKRIRVIYVNDDIKEVEMPSSKVSQLQPYQLGPCMSMVKLFPELPGRKEPESAPEVTVPHSEVAVSSENHSEAKKPCDFQIKVAKNSVKYKRSHMGHSVIKQTESSDSCEPPAKRIRIICDDDDIREVEKPSIKVWQLKSYQLAPYVSVTKLHPEFFKVDSTYNLKDLKVAAKARLLSMVVRKPGTVGHRIAMIDNLQRKRDSSRLRMVL